MDQDSGGRIAKSCETKLGKAIERKCAGVSLLNAFPGCNTDDPAELTVCFTEIARCRLCQALNAADALVRDCDLFDDGQADRSCGREP